VSFSRHPSDARLLEGRIALVTGADSGIGKEVSYELARHGAAVAITHHSDKGVAETMAGEIEEAGGRAVTSLMDVTDEEAVQQAFGKAREILGPVDLLVNNAGIESHHPLMEMSLETWRLVIDVNLTGAFLCTREAARMMRDASLAGTIVNISSVHELIPWESYSHYCASKGGMKLFTQTIAKELAPLGIRILSVAPGAIETPINHAVLEDPEKSAEVLAQIPAGRWGNVGDIAGAVAWLASDQASYVTGATLFVDGGMTLYPGFV